MIWDRASFMRCIAQLRPALLVRLKRYAPSPLEAEDLLQEAYARVLRMPWWKLMTIQSPEGYIWKVAWNVLRNSRKHEAVVQQWRTALDYAESFDDGPEDIASRQQLAERFLEALKELHPRYRDALVLRKVEGYSQEEIAKHMNIKLHTVESYVSKALALVRHKMARWSDLGE